jgi:eukaryotic-like serine/threonine-protein kinase
MAHYIELAKTDPRVPRFASLFVNDRQGTQLASVFDDKSISLSIGKNWAHRTYFHGGPDELDALDRPPADPPHIETTHLSAVFQSSSQKTWKVAISTPIFRDSAGERRFAGILVLTVDLGDFNFAVTAAPQARDQFLVLADGRPGSEQGTILHHPLFRELAARGKGIPQALIGRDYRVPQALLNGEGDTAYHDPLGRFRDEAGLAQAFDRRWLAASAPVLPPIGAAKHSESGLVVLVQSDYQSVVRPARQLGQQFIKNSFWMFVVMLTVSLSLWYIVVRMFREPRAGLTRPPTPVPESTPYHGMTTVPAARRE